jgi:Tol biopolymer transport system component
VLTSVISPAETPTAKPSVTLQPSRTPRPSSTATSVPTHTTTPVPTAIAVRCSIGEGIGSGGTTISADGRWVLFESDANYLVEGERNECRDIFLYDLENDTVERVSNGWDGSESNGHSQDASLSEDGRWIVFASEASNLVEGDSNGQSDIFLHDREQGTTKRISVAPDGAQGNDESLAPVISASGRWVAFWSRATNFTGGDGGACSRPGRGGISLSINCRNIFIYDLEQKYISELGVRVNVGFRNYGDPTALSISDNGRWVLFALHRLDGIAEEVPYRGFVSYDREMGILEPLLYAESYMPIVSQSADGQWLLFTAWTDDLVPEDINNAGDVFLLNRVTNSLELVSINPEGGQFAKDSGILHCFECAPYQGQALSDDGHWVVFLSAREDDRCFDPFGPDEPIACYEFFIRDLENRTTRRFLSSNDGGLLDGDSAEPRLSADGRWIVFSSVARNLLPVPEESFLNVFAYDQVNDTLKLLSGPR